MLICSSPQLFAACHVLLRRLMPRHPPYALISLILVVLSHNLRLIKTILQFLSLTYSFFFSSFGSSFSELQDFNMFLYALLLSFSLLLSLLFYHIFVFSSMQLSMCKMSFVVIAATGNKKSISRYVKPISIMPSGITCVIHCRQQVPLINCYQMR